MENKCVVCGADIPEGRMVCPNCDCKMYKAELVSRKGESRMYFYAENEEKAIEIANKNKAKNQCIISLEEWKPQESALDRAYKALQKEFEERAKRLAEMYSEGGCKWKWNGICLCNDSPILAQVCPLTQNESICKFRE